MNVAVPEVRVGGPFDELELPHQQWAQPPAVFHFLCRDALSPSPRAFLREAEERAVVREQGRHLLDERGAACSVNPFLVFAAKRRPVSS